MGSGNHFTTCVARSWIKRLPLADFFGKFLLWPESKSPHLLRNVSGAPHREPLGDPGLPQRSLPGQGPGDRDTAPISAGQGREIRSFPARHPEVSDRPRDNEFGVADRVILRLTAAPEILRNGKNPFLLFRETVEQGFLEALTSPIPAFSQGALEGLPLDLGQAALLACLRMHPLFEPLQEMPAIGGTITALEEGESFINRHPGFSRFRADGIPLGQAAPRIIQKALIGRGGNETGADRIEMDVVEKRPQIEVSSISAGFDEDGLVAVTEQASPFTVTGVEAPCVGVLKPPHAIDEIAAGCFKKEVVVVAHQDPRPDAEPRAIAAITESLEEELFIRFLRRGKDAVAAIAARHHVVKRAFVFDADLAGHARWSLAGGRLSNCGLVP